MKWTIVLLTLVLGCSSESDCTEANLDAGADAQTDADACVAEVVTDGVWYCESCACGATECRVRNGQTGVTTVGICSEVLECSEPCPVAL